MDDCGNCGDCDFDCCDCDCKCDDCLQGGNVFVLCCCLSSTNNNNNQTSSSSKRNSDGSCCCCCYGRRDPPKVKEEKNKKKKKKKKKNGGICWRIWCYCCLCCSKDPDLSPPPSPPHPKSQDSPFGKGSNDSSKYEKHLDKTSEDYGRAGGQSNVLKNERVVPSSISYSPEKKHPVIPVRDKEDTERYRKDHNYGRDKREEYFEPPSKDKYRWDGKYGGMPEELESDYYRHKHDKFDKYGDRDIVKKYGYGKRYSKYDDEEFGFGRKGYGYGERGDKYSKREEMGMSVVKGGYGGKDEKLAARHYELEKPKRDDQDKKKAEMARKQGDDLVKEHQKMREEVKITAVERLVQGDHNDSIGEGKKDQAQGEKLQTPKDTPSTGGTHQKDDGQDVKVTKPVELSVMPSMEQRYGRQSTAAAKSQAGDYDRVDPMLDELGKL